MKKIMLISLQIILAIAMVAQTASTLNSKGFRQAKKDNYTRAIELFTKALEADSQFTDAWTTGPWPILNYKSIPKPLRIIQKQLTSDPGLRWHIITAEPTGTN